MYLTHMLYINIYIFTVVQINVYMYFEYCESQILGEDTDYFFFRIVLQ